MAMHAGSVRTALMADAAAPVGLAVLPSGDVAVLTGSARSPQLATFQAQSEERNARFAGAMQKHPRAVSNVLKQQRAIINTAMHKGERCFTLATLDARDEVITVQTHARALLPWMHAGKLVKDDMFVHYVEKYDVHTQHLIYITFPKSEFISAVIGLPADALAHTVAQHAAAGPSSLSHEQTASFKSACTNTRCGAMDKTLLTCSRCQRAQYCSKACQKSDWKHHKRYCKQQ
jgi:hypothetical protein